MDRQYFDTLTRKLTGAGTRRGLLGLLVTLPGLRGLFALLAADDGAAKGRRTRSVGGENHKRGGRRRKHKSHHHRKQDKRCAAESLAQTCADQCGTVLNNCKKPVECDSCVCGDVCASGCPFTSLQAAVDAASSGDIIRICAGTYLGADAIADIDKDLTIVGAGDGADPATETILDADEAALVLRIRSPRTVTLEGLRITGGAEGGGFVGGGVYNEGDLTMTGCTVTGNRAGTSGSSGGVYSDGTLTMTDCTVSENSTSAANAGGIRADGELRLTRCTIRENTGVVGGFVVQGTTTLTETTITANTGLVATLPGGLYASSGATTLVDRTVSGNTPRNCRVAGSGTITGPGCAP